MQFMYIVTIPNMNQRVMARFNIVTSTKTNSQVVYNRVAVSHNWLQYKFELMIYTCTDLI